MVIPNLPQVLAVSLILELQEDMLGPNPFINKGGFDDAMGIGFDPSVLVKCESNQVHALVRHSGLLSAWQLRVVGDLVHKGVIELHASDDTILFTGAVQGVPSGVDEVAVSVDSSVDTLGDYTIKVFTVLTHAGPPEAAVDFTSWPEHHICRVSS